MEKDLEKYLSVEYPKLLLKVFDVDNNKISYLDKDNVLWIKVNNTLVGKRAVTMSNNAVRWIENKRADEEVKTYLHGVLADYNETFYK